MKIIQQEKSEMPIFDGIKFKNLIITAGGGGGQEFGLPNKIEALDGQSLKSLFFLSTTDLFESIYVSEVYDYLIAVSDNKFVLISISNNSFSIK
jgi:hypothetical protein